VVDITLHLGDCLGFLSSLQSGGVDVVITDPPYGIGESSVKNSTRSKMVSVKNSTRSKMVSVKNYGEYLWDKKLSREYIDAILRVGKHQVIFGGNYYADWLPPSSSWIVWDKLNSGDFADCELAWTSHKKAIRKFAYMWNGCFKQKPEERFHPTQKPLSLMLWVVENYSKLGDTVLDPFMGSGTTGVACAILGRNFMGCDNREDYYQISKRRIDAAQAQLSLFDHR
jgi:DNA modification methylase